MVELSAIWVVVIVLIGIAIGVYSVCKGCQGMREQAAQTVQNERNAMVAPLAGLVQQLRADEAHQNRLFVISGSTIYDKNPPSYDEIIEPPPSYEETLKFCSAEVKGRRPEEVESSAHVNLGCDEPSEEGACACPPAPVHVVKPRDSDGQQQQNHVAVHMDP